MTEGLRAKIERFEKDKELSLELHELKELQKFCQVHFNFRVDIHCNSCVARHAERVAKYLKKND